MYSFQEALRLAAAAAGPARITGRPSLKAAYPLNLRSNHNLAEGALRNGPAGALPDAE